MSDFQDFHLLDKLRERCEYDTNLSTPFLIEEESTLSFEATCQKIYSLSKVLLSYQIDKGDRVALLLERGIEATIVIYSILSIGAVYVPLNKNDPTERLNFIITKTGTKLVIGKGIKPTNLQVKLWYKINLDDFVCKSNLLNFWNFIRYNEIACILYTSGSTGVPKLVALSHKAMIAFADWSGKIFNISHNDSIANLAPFSFDLSVFDLFTSLRFGSKLVFMPQSITMSPLLLSKWLQKNNITVWYTVPRILSFWANKGNLKNFKNYLKLRLIMFAGEVFPTVDLFKLVNLLPKVDFYNLYGPVETNVCSFWPVDLNRVKTLEPIPIGFPACNNELIIDNVNNELLVKGPTLMLGYWDNHLKKHEGWHRTGDCVEINEKGEYLYKGRKDRMFKYFGYRIEPEEIEAAFIGVPQVKECVVLCVNKGTQQLLVACIVFFQELKKSELVQKIKDLIPSYMIPTHFIKFKKMPSLINGKKDFKKIEVLVLNKIQNKILC